MKDHSIPRGVTSRELPRRSVAFALFGVFLIAMGVGVFDSPVYDPESAVLYESIPRHARAWLWIGTGTVTLVFSFCKHRQWVSSVAAILMPLERIVSYLWAFAMWAVPGPPEGHLTAIGDALRWAAFALLIVLIAGWIEYDRPNAKE